MNRYDYANGIGAVVWWKDRFDNDYCGKIKNKDGEGCIDVVMSGGHVTTIYEEDIYEADYE